jgi:CBS domain containing-hemolysin-like protein
MVPRDRTAVPELSGPPGPVLEAVRRGARARVPVYEGDLDNVIGVVKARELSYLFSRRGVVALEGALYPPLSLKPDEGVAGALERLRKARRPQVRKSSTYLAPAPRQAFGGDDVAAGEVDHGPLTA